MVPAKAVSRHETFLGVGVHLPSVDVPQFVFVLTHSAELWYQ